MEAHITHTEDCLIKMEDHLIEKEDRLTETEACFTEMEPPLMETEARLTALFFLRMPNFTGRSEKTVGINKNIA
jgi:hypothetical protein